MSVEQALATRLDGVRVRRIVLALFGVAAVWCVVRGGPLSWDEAVYAARAKDFVDSNFGWGATTGDYWSDVRAPGLPVAQAVVFRILLPSDMLARLVVVVAAVGLLVMIGRTLDVVAPRRVGTTAILLAATCPGFLATSTLGFADIPAALAGVAAVWATLRACVLRSTRALVAVPPLLGIATTLRFGGSLLVVAPLGVVATLIAISLVSRRDWRRLAAYAAAGVASLVVVAALLTTTLLTDEDSPLAATRDLVERNELPANQWITDLRDILSPGPVDYGFGGPFWGLSYAVVFGAALLLAVVRLLVHRRFWMLLACGLIGVTPILLYAATVNQFVTTYLAPILAIFAAAVSLGIWAPDVDVPASAESTGSRASAPPAPPEVSAKARSSPARWAFPVVMVVAAAVGLASVRSVDDMHDRLEGFEQLRLASVIADDLLGDDCRLATRRYPQVSWYSDCHVRSISPPFESSDSLEPVPDEQLDAYLAEQAERTGLDPQGTFALVLMDGIPGQPPIDAVWERRVVESSVILSAPDDRRVVVVALEAP